MSKGTTIALAVAVMFITAALKVWLGYKSALVALVVGVGFLCYAIFSKPNLAELEIIFEDDADYVYECPAGPNMQGVMRLFKVAVRSKDGYKTVDEVTLSLVAMNPRPPNFPLPLPLHPLHEVASLFGPSASGSDSVGVHYGSLPPAGTRFFDVVYMPENGEGYLQIYTRAPFDSKFARRRYVLKLRAEGRDAIPAERSFVAEVNGEGKLCFYPLSPETESTSSGAKLLRGILASAVVTLFLGGIWEYLTLAGVISMGLARVFLVIAWIVGVAGVIVSELVWKKSLKHRALIGAGVAVLLGAAFLGLDRWAIHHRSSQAEVVQGTKEVSPPTMIAGITQPVQTPAPSTALQIPFTKEPAPKTGDKKQSDAKCVPNIRIGNSSSGTISNNTFANIGVPCPPGVQVDSFSRAKVEGNIFTQRTSSSSLPLRVSNVKLIWEDMRSLYNDSPYCKKLILQTDVEEPLIGFVITLSAPVQRVTVINLDVMVQGAASINTKDNKKIDVAFRGMGTSPLRPDHPLSLVVCGSGEFTPITLEKAIVQ